MEPASTPLWLSRLDRRGLMVHERSVVNNPVKAANLGSIPGRDRVRVFFSSSTESVTWLKTVTPWPVVAKRGRSY